MNCPECGSFNSVLASECEDCGEPLTDVPAKMQHQAAAEQGEIDQDAQQSEHGVSTAHRVAAAYMLLTVPVGLGLRLYAPALTQKLSTALGVGVVLSGILGTLIILGNPWGKRFAVALQLLGLGGILFNPNPTTSIPIGLGSTAVLLLLLGNASRTRMALGIVAALSPIPAAAALAAWAPDDWSPPGEVKFFDLEAPTNVLTGRGFTYKLALESSGWHLLKPRAQRRLASRSDAYAANVRTGATLRVFVKRSEKAAPTVLGYEHSAAVPVSTLLAPAEVVSPLRPYPERSRVVRITWQEAGQLWKGFRAVLVGRDWQLEMQLEVPLNQFFEHESELRAVIDSIRVPDAALLPPDDAVTETSSPLPFDITVRGRGWYRTEANTQVKQDAPADSTIWVQPYLAAVLYVWPERGSMADVTLEQSVDDRIARMRALGRNVERLGPATKTAGSDALVLKLRITLEKTTKVAWFSIVRRGEDAIVAMLEVPPEVADFLAADAQATLGSLRPSAAPSSAQTER